MTSPALLDTRAPRLAARWSTAALAVAAAACVVLSGCEQKKPKDAPASAQEHASEPATLAFEAPKAVDLTAPESFDRKKLDLSAPRKFPDCYHLFESDGAVVDRFPLLHDDIRPVALAGCGPEAYLRLDDGTRYIAYASPADGPGWDMQLAAFAPSGDKMWSYHVDRSENAKNFTANFRGSYITPLLPRLVCAGTLWEGGTQAACVDAKSGKAEFDGMMHFWSGVAPQGLENGLNAATINGLSRRYPYSGVEMRFKAFEESGGRIAYYATDAKRLYFAPGVVTQDKGNSEQGASEQDNKLRLTAYDLASFEPLWRLALPDRPRPTWTHAFAEAKLVLFKIGDTIYAVDTSPKVAGADKIRWAAKVGDDEPPVVVEGGRLYLLLRRKVDSNLLFAIDPESGEVDWYAPVPTGTLELSNFEDTLLLKSVRAVQKVNDVE